MTTRAHLRVVIRDNFGAVVSATSVNVYKLATTTGIADAMCGTLTGGIPLSNPLTTDANGVAEAFFDVPGTDVPGLVTLTWSTGSEIFNVQTTSEKGSSIWPLAPGAADTAPQVYWYVNKFTGRDPGPGYWGDGYAGVTPDKPFQTVAQALLKIPTGAKAVLVLGGNVSTDIATMLATPASYHVYELTSQLILDSSVGGVAGIIGQGVDAKSGRAGTLIVDGAGFPSDQHLIVVRPGGALINGFGIVNRVGPGCLVATAGPATDIRSIAAYQCRGHGFEVRSSATDLLVLDRCESYLNRGHGFEVTETATDDLPDQVTFRDCDSTGNLMAEVHVAVADLGGVARLRSGNGIRFANLRAHREGLLGKVFVEGGHDVAFDQGYWEMGEKLAKDIPMVTVRGMRRANGADWFASRSYALGEYVRGITGSARWGYWKSTTAGTSGATEPKWGIGMGAMSSGSAVLTCDQAVFASSMAGKAITVLRAGSGGDPLVTTISAFVSSTQVTLAATAAATVSDAPFNVATVVDGGVTWTWSIPPGPRRWTDLPAGGAVSVDQAVIPSRYPSNGRRTGDGKMWVCTTAGTIGGSEPLWPNIGTITDGTVVWKVLDTHLLTCARLVRFRNLYLHGYDIQGTWSANVPRWFDLNFCQDVKARDLNLGAAITPTTNEPFARFRSQAWDCEVDARAAVDYTGGFAPFSAPAQFLFEDSPGANWNRAVYQAQWTSTVPARIVVIDANNRPLPDVVVLTDGATVAVNAALGDVHRLTLASNAFVRTLDVPANAKQGQMITFEIVNGSGGTFTATNLAFNAVYLKTGAFPATNMGSGKRRTIRFRHTGANWVEVSRADGDM
jgi:hypothetical protein